MEKAGVDITDKESIGKYMSTHVPIKPLSYNSGFNNINRNHGALYTDAGFSNYGDMTFMMKKPTDFTKGKYEDWLSDLYNYQKYDPSVNNVANWTRPNNGLPSNKISNTFVGEKGKKIFDNANLVTGDIGRIKSADLPGLSKPQIITRLG